MWSSFKAFLRQVPGGAGTAGLASVAAVALVGVGVYRSQVVLAPAAKPVAVAALKVTEPVSKPETLAPVPTAKTEPAPQVAIAPAPAASSPSPPPAVAPSPVAAPAPVIATAEPPKPVPPAFDIARVEPSGDTLVAGRSLPNADVSLLDDGKIIGQIKTDAAGQFVLLPKGLEPGSHLLSLRAKATDGTDLPSEQNITVVVPQNKKEGVLVALTAPGEATKILSDVKPAPAVAANAPAKPVEQVHVLIRSVEAGEGGALFATGTANSGQAIQLYLSGTAIAKATTAADGHWSLKVAKGMKPGAYQVRADAVTDKGEVVARAEVPFDYPAVAPVQLAEVKTPQKTIAPVANPAVVAAPPATPQPATVAAAPAAIPSTAVAPAAPGVADAVVKQLDTAIVTRGDSLWRISRKVYGRGIRYTQIYEANTGQIRDPKLIYPGQVFVLPAADSKN